MNTANIILASKFAASVAEVHQKIQVYKMLIISHFKNDPPAVLTGCMLCNWLNWTLGGTAVAYLSENKGAVNNFKKNRCSWCYNKLTLFI